MPLRQPSSTAAPTSRWRSWPSALASTVTHSSGSNSRSTTATSSTPARSRSGRATPTARGTTATRRSVSTLLTTRPAQQAWRPTIDGIPGNDDLGGLSAWYIWTALGFGPFTPGAPLYMVGSPIFDRASIALRHGHFTVEAPGASLVGKYVQSAALNGKPLERTWSGDDALRPGGVLHLGMGPLANTTWA